MDSSDEEFGFTNSIYRCYFQMQFEWPCLSFDVLRDDLGSPESRLRYPHTAYFVSATQASEDAENQLLVTKISELNPTKYDDDLDESLLVDPNVKVIGNSHPSIANRVRSMPQQWNIVATWSQSGSVYIWDIGEAIFASNGDTNQNLETYPIAECANNGVEGFGLAWSRINQGILAMGDDNGLINLWSETETTFTNVSSLQAYSQSIEDIVFSPQEANVFACCTVGGYIQLWDTNSLATPAIQIQAYPDDIDCNVIDWNPIQKNLLISGSDDGVIKVWDLRNPAQPLVQLPSHHTDSITSIEWNPHDEAEFACSSEDGRVTIWDLSVEAFDPGEKEEGIPDQLLFEHSHDDPKELHYHPQIPSMIAVMGATFDVFIPDIEGDAGEPALPPEGYVPPEPAPESPANPEAVDDGEEEDV